MPLTKPASRKLMHTRTVHCAGYLRDDGLWDIEGHLTDTKPFDIPSEDRGGTIPAGEPLHEMWIRLTVDLDLVVQDVEARTDHGPHHLCGNIVDNFKVLKGLVIKSGWTQKTRELLGGTRGCTHLVELLGPVATTAYQTIYPARVKRDRDKPLTHKPGLVDSCHAYAADGPIVKRRWPQFYTGPGDTGDA
jgi:hypothetical protein